MSTIKLIGGRRIRERQAQRAATVRHLQMGVAQAMQAGHIDAAAKLASRADWLHRVHHAPNWTGAEKDVEFKRTLSTLQEAA